MGKHLKDTIIEDEEEYEDEYAILNILPTHRTRGRPRPRNLRSYRPPAR
jgi:hypothetical protein